MLTLIAEEKYLISQALNFAKKFKDNDLGHLEFINDINEDLAKENLLFSRTQISIVVYYLDNLLAKTPSDSAKIIELQQKLNNISDLP